MTVWNTQTWLIWPKARTRAGRQVSSEEFPGGHCCAERRLTGRAWAPAPATPQRGQWAAGRVLVFTLTNLELWKAAVCSQGSHPGASGGEPAVLGRQSFPAGFLTTAQGESMSRHSPTVKTWTLRV